MALVRWEWQWLSGLRDWHPIFEPYRVCAFSRTFDLRRYQRLPTNIFVQPPAQIAGPFHPIYASVAPRDVACIFAAAQQAALGVPIACDFPSTAPLPAQAAAPAACAAPGEILGLEGEDSRPCFNSPARSPTASRFSAAGRPSGLLFVASKYHIIK